MNPQPHERTVAEITRQIKDKVSLGRRPIGIARYDDPDEAPAKARIPSAKGEAWPLCLALNLVRTLGWTIALGPEDHFCMFAAAGLGHIEMPDYLGHGAIGCQHTQDDALGRKLQDWIESHFLEPGAGLMLTPAIQPRFEPQGVLFYGNPSQVGKIAKGVAWYQGEPVRGWAGGFGCFILGIWASLQAREPRVIIPSSGEKILGHTEENEVLLACPADDLPDVLAGMEATDRILPYPSAKFLMFEPKRFPKGYPIDLISQKTFQEWKAEQQ